MSAVTRFPRTEIEPRRPLGRLPRARNGGRQGRLAGRLGGPGDEVNRVDRPAGDITCLACAASYLFFCSSSLLHHFYSFFRSFYLCFLLPIRFLFASSLRLFSTILLVSFASASCVSPHRSDAQIVRVLDAEAKLLESLKEERRHPPLLNALHGNETVSDAEAHLRDALDRLIKANAEMRATLKNR